MKRLPSHPKGITLVELLIYMGLSTLLVIGMVGFLIQTTHERTKLAAQQSVQQNARVVMGKMTTTIRNAYVIEVNEEGNEITAYSQNYEDLHSPIKTIYRAQGSDLAFERGEVMAAAASQTLLDSGVTLVSLHAEKIASSVRMTATFEKDGRRVTLSSTVAYRQK